MRGIAFIIGLLCTAPSWAATWYAIPETGLRPDGVACSSNGDGTAKTCAASNGATGAWIGTNNINAASTNPGDTVKMCNTSATAGFIRSSSWAFNDVGLPGLPIRFDGNCTDIYTGGIAFATLTNTGGSFNLSATTGQYREWWNIRWKGGASNDCVKYTSTAGHDLFYNNTFERCVGGGLNLQGTVGSNIVTSPDYHTEDSPTCDGSVGAGMTACVATLSPNNFIFRVTGVETGTTGALNNTDMFAIDDGSGGTSLYDVGCYRNKSGDGSCIDVQDSTAGDIANPINVSNFYAKDPEGTGLSSTGYSFVTFSGGIIDGAGTYGIYPKGADGTRQRYVNLTIANSGTYGAKVGASAIGVPTGVDIRNNIFYNSGGVNVALDVDGATVTIDYNLYFGGPGFASNITGTTCDGLYPSLCTFAQWREQSGIDVHSTDGTDPEFTGDNYCLDSGSPALAAGTYIGAQIVGYRGESLTNPPPIGARGLCQPRRAAATRRVAW